MASDPQPPTAAVDDAPLNTVDALVQLSFAVHRILGEVGAERGLSVIQVRLLGVLRDRTAGMLELATVLGLDKSSMTGLVARAEKRGLLRRSPSPHDGRAVLVSLTDDGKDLTDWGTAEIGRRISALTDGLTLSERARITELASAVVQAQRSSASTWPS
ncbi:MULTISPECIES: MarR family winged helix-turn-helix transcriptional regulator [unclassified Streptomyces]|jgi:Transcriptional regulators|uniref:MarR family winged helix-turn-helix transcriptional regulator n=1 Tax=unclassified Streptomyces TaxID=2593676 RepID=UPI002E274CE4